MSGDVNTKQGRNLEKGSDAKTETNPLSKDQKQLIFDYSIGLATQEQADHILTLIASSEEAAEIYCRLEGLKALLGCVKPEPCPDDLVERVNQKAAELHRAEKKSQEQEPEQTLAQHDDANKSHAAKGDKEPEVQSPADDDAVNDPLLDWPAIQSLWPNIKGADAVEKFTSGDRRTGNPKRRHAVKPLVSYRFSRAYRKTAVTAAMVVMFVITLGFFDIIDKGETIPGEALPLSVSPPVMTTPGLVSGILFTDDKPSAIVGAHIVHEGDVIGSVTVLKIHRDRVEFNKAGTTWTQRPNQGPNPNWHTAAPAPNPADI